MSRSDRWHEPRYFPLGVSSPDANPDLVEALKKCPEAKSGQEMTTWDLIGASRELILRVVEDKYELDFIEFGLDAKTGSLMLARTWSGIDLDENEVKKQLAGAVAQDVPVYPDDEDAADHLARLHVSLFTDGFTMDREGEPIRYEWRGNKRITYDPDIDKWQIEPTASLFPADTLALAREANERQQLVVEAVRVLNDLRSGVDELSRLLENDTRDEGSLQRCLTRFPILFGLQYQRVIPKYRLGSDFELDFALEITYGLVDLVEIEASNLRLYTKVGNPTKELVHAEQQILDWLEWLEANARLARDDLPGMMRSVGQVIIGRRNSLSSNDLTRLRRRNATWQGSIQVLTYDDLLDRARNVIDLLTKSREPKNP